MGCGTGTLTAQLSDYADTIVGVDSSASMIAKAKQQYDNIPFWVCDALALPFEKEFDVVFSNAVFHWITDHNALLMQVYKALKPNGLLICEFGANGNVATIEKAFRNACQDFEYQYTSKFNFPTVNTFSDLLEKNNFIIDKIYDYNRPTPLRDNERGLANWMRQFFATDLELMSENMQDEIIKKVVNLTKERLWNGDEWTADYRRLRVIAHI